MIASLDYSTRVVKKYSWGGGRRIFRVVKKILSPKAELKEKGITETIGKYVSAFAFLHCWVGIR